MLAVISPVCLPGGRCETFWEPVMIGRPISAKRWLKAAISVKGRQRMTVMSGENLGRKAEMPSSHISDSVMFWLLFQLPMTYFTMLIIYAKKLKNSKTQDVE